MTKRVLSKYKKYKQTYIDLWIDGKRNVKIIKKIFLLNCILLLIELKKSYLFEARIEKSKRIFARWNIAKTNAKLLPQVEILLRHIPSRYLTLNSKSRIYKYIMRRNQYLFQSRDQIVGDLIFILQRKRKKPFWRRTKYERLFRLKHTLQQYYGNMSYIQFKNLVSKYHLSASTSLLITTNKTAVSKPRFFALALYQLLELRLDILIYRSAFVHSMFFARQLITTGYVFVNGVTVRSCNVIVKLFDCIELRNTASIAVSLFFSKLDAVYIFYTELGFFKIFSSWLRYRLYKTLFTLTRSFSLYLMGIELQLITHYVHALDADILGDLVLYTRFLNYCRAIPKHLLVTSTSVLPYKKPSMINYPFSYPAKQFQKVVNYLSA